jgi:hypothetical protein
MSESFALKFGRPIDFVLILHGFEDVNLNRLAQKRYKITFY